MGDDFNRRDLLRAGWKLGTTALAAAAGYTTYEALRPLASEASGGTFDVGSPVNFEDDSAQYFPSGRFYVVNSRSELFALSQRCPHLGCRVPFCESSGRFECPCHGSVFDLAGEWISGPSPRGLDRFDIALVDGNVVVDTTASTDGPDRGADAHFAPPKGPSCLDES